ncbi:putative peptidylprolyl isomerase [Helianthus annuus]|nr:putative peptidylprolyl isomerase [Helianthus annuus]
MADNDIKTLVTQRVGEKEEICNLGLKKIIEEGDGLENPQCGDLVEVHYTGFKLDGTPVWSSRKTGKPLKLTISQVLLLP